MGRVKIILSPRFRDALRRKYKFIRERNPQAAKKVREHIIKVVDRLSEYPASGRSWRLEGALELVVPGLPYVIIYDIEKDTIRVLTLFHTARNFPPEDLR